MSHKYTRFVFDGDWYFDGWLCLGCLKRISIETAPSGPPQDESECVVAEVKDEA